MKILNQCSKCTKEINPNCEFCQGKGEFLTTFEEFFKISAEPRIKRSFSRNRNLYLSNSIDYEDLNQDIYCSLYGTYKRHKDNPEINPKKLGIWLTEAITHRFIRITKRSTRTRKYVRFTDEDLSNLANVKNKVNLFECFIKPHCSELEYEVLYSKICLQCTFDSIAKELNCSKPYIHQVYNRILSKLKKKLKKDLTF